MSTGLVRLLSWTCLVLLLGLVVFRFLGSPGFCFLGSVVSFPLLRFRFLRPNWFSDWARWVSSPGLAWILLLGLGRFVSVTPFSFPAPKLFFRLSSLGFVSWARLDFASWARSFCFRCSVFVSCDQFGFPLGLVGFRLLGSPGFCFLGSVVSFPLFVFVPDTHQPVPHPNTTERQGRHQHHT